MARSHSSWLGSISLIAACRCRVSTAITSRKRGLAWSLIRALTMSAERSSSKSPPTGIWLSEYTVMA
ncbi:hypothetical protein [Pseudomonas fragi]|uniref:hypothetical protein n=1 Tax=Pseudomonas fragi TaxID=296 RepID=UPI002D78B0D2|nr:hypothetical protein [Pseudomonas fragi]WRT63084.1 hypothetical protein VK847_10160 [Pseudomonas fragi]